MWVKYFGYRQHFAQHFKMLLQRIIAWLVGIVGCRENLITTPWCQSWVYSGVALIPFQACSGSGVDPMCTTPWSRTYAEDLFCSNRVEGYHSTPVSSSSLKFPALEWVSNFICWQKCFFFTFCKHC